MTAKLCPECRGPTSVLTTRPSATTPDATRRRRVCQDCGHSFSTIEALETAVIAESFIIELVLVDKFDQAPTTTTTMVEDLSKIGGEVARLAGPRTYPATIHHWRLHRAVNGMTVEWRKEKTFKWP